jgi:alpha-tubulin suppressor-like RCC1 family protein
LGLSAANALSQGSSFLATLGFVPESRWDSVLALQTDFMSALVRKEIRLLLPAWIAAVLLIVAPIPLGEMLGQGFASSTMIGLTVYAVAIGCLIIGLAGFGREMSSHTFSLLLAQPRARREFWRAKVLVLLVSLIPLALFLALVSRQFVPASERWESVLIWFVSACVAISGGLWTTLLFRQVIASFWISLLVPFAILVSVLNLDDYVVEPETRTTIVTVLLLAYSIAGYWFARWQFLHAQDTAWTGGNLALPQLDRWLPWKRTASAPQQSHPLLALLGKELQFQQINFLLAGVLLVVQLAALLLHKFVKTSEYSVLDMVVEHFWGIWIVMPLLVGGSAVAEERKLGTLDSQLCLPVSRAWQFAMKVLVALVCGILLGAVVPVALDLTHAAITTRGGDFIVGWTILCACVTLVSLYGSSLTNQVLQAFGAAIGISVVGLLLGNWFAGTFSAGGQFTLFGFGLWRGPLVLLMGAGVMLVAAMIFSWRRLRWIWVAFLAVIALALLRGEIQSSFAGGLATDSYEGFKIITLVGVAAALCPVALTLVLAAQNFKHTQPSLSLWRRNAAVWLGCLVITGIITTLVYSRAWERLMRFEPPAGPPRLSGPVQPAIANIWAQLGTLVLLPDGRLSTFKGYERIAFPSSAIGDGGQQEPTWRTVTYDKARVEFVGDSNWVAVTCTSREVLGVKSDGSLWSAPLFEQVDQRGNVVHPPTGSRWQKGWKQRTLSLQFEQVGNSSDWNAVASSWNHCVTLKRGGTIWGWGDNSNGQLGDGPKVITNAPAQIGIKSDWAAVFASPGHSFAVNQEGEIWKWGRFATDIWGRTFENGPVKLDLKVTGVRAIASEGNFDLILDTDGHLWGIGRIPPSLFGKGNTPQLFTAPVRLPGENWSAVSLSWQGMAALKSDGSLWNQPVSRIYDEISIPPVRLGDRTDWIAVSKDWNSLLALARDGTICRFGEPDLEPKPELLAPTRRVTWSLNLLDAAP